MKTKNPPVFYSKRFLAVSIFFGLGLVLLYSNINSDELLSKFTRNDITSSNAVQYWVPSETLNPYFSKLSTTHSNQLDQLTLAILGKGRNLSNENFIIYLTNLNKGFGVIAKKPNYIQDIGVQNIIGYLSYEIGSTVAALTQTTASVIGNNGTVSNQGNIGPDTATLIRDSVQTTTSERMNPKDITLNANISIPGLKYSVNGYEPVKIGKNIEIKYDVTGAKSCKGWYAKTGETRGYEVQFASIGANGNSQGGNSTTQSSGVFSIPVNYPTYLEFTCIDSANKEIKKTLNISSKLHDENDTYIKLDKEAIIKIGEVVTLSWQSSNQSNWKYCHLLKTQSINGTKSDPTVILETGINLAQRKSGVITDIIQKPGDYVYVLNCNDIQTISADTSVGSLLSSKKLSFAVSTTTPTNKSASGVPYSEIKAYIDSVLLGTASDKEKAQAIFNQMNASQVTEEDIFNAYAGTLSRADISKYLTKRNELAVVIVPTVPQIHPDTSAFDIANIYRNHIESIGGDTQLNQSAAIEYLRKRGVSDGKIQEAYKIFLGDPNGSMAIIHNIAAWFRANPTATDAQIVKWMKVNKVDASQVSKATGVSVEEISQRYTAADSVTHINTSPGTWENTSTPTNKSASGVPYSEIKTYIDSVLAGAGTDKEKAQTIFNQMNASQVTEEDIFNAYAGALSRADISKYLSFR